MVDDIRGRKMPDVKVSGGSNEPVDDIEPEFETPEQVAADEEVIDMAEVDTKATGKDNKSKDKKPDKLKVWLSDLKYWYLNQPKKQRIIIVVVAGLLLCGLIGGSTYALLHKPKAVQQAAPEVKKEEAKAEPPKPTTEASHLTGVQVSPEFNELPVTGIMIENSPDARPQSGLKDAGVVFEAVAEGGITRFLTLFQESQPDYVGPVRSVRPYYLQWLQAFDAPIAHVGGSPEALAKIRNDGIKDLDQFYNGGAYQRVSQRYAPHNVYTSLGSLIALEKSKGVTSSNFTGFARKEEKKLDTPIAKSIDFSISGPLYNAHYDYDAATNSYLRSEGGAPHKDERSGKQISPKVVIALIIPQGIDADGIHTTYQAIGSGKAFIFQDGGVTEGTWSKGSDKEQLRFGDANGAPLALNPGQTWISMVGQASGVMYKP